MKLNSTVRRHRRQSGMSMPEVLAAVVVAGVAITGLIRLQADAAASTAQLRERSQAVQAVRMAAEAARGGVSVSAAIAIATAPASPPAGPASFAIEARVQGEGVTQSLTLDARWLDRRGESQAVPMTMQWPPSTIDARAAMDTMADGRWLAPMPAGPEGRHPDIPRPARELDSHHDFVPSTLPGLAGWIVDRRSAAVRSACSVAPAAAASGDRDAQADPCRPLAGRLITGTLRFALGPAPAAAGPFDEPMPVEVVMLDEAGRVQWPGCEASAVRGDDAHLAWRCFVPAPQLAQDGRAAAALPVFRPAGWRLDGDAPTHRLCWYEAAARAAQGRGRARALNALIVREPSACPAGTVALEG